MTLTHLLSAGDLSRDEAVRILDTAEELLSVASRPIKKLPTLRGRTVVNLFFRGLDPYPDLLRGGGQAALGRRHQLLGQGLERLQG
jgi:hypothetical protein